MSFSRIPEPNRNFHRSHQFNKAQEYFNCDTKTALILEGLVGSGKSEIAYQLVKDVTKGGPRERFLTCMLNGSSVQTLLNDLRDLSSDLSLGVKVESLHHFQDIFASLNKEHFDVKIKIFLFDDMIQNDDPDILNCTVLAALRSLNNGNSNKKDRWKFLVTTQHQTGNITDDVEHAIATLKVTGFSENDTLQFFQKGNLTRVPEVNIKELHDQMMGSPLGLNFAQQQLRNKCETLYESYIQLLREDAEKLVKDSSNDSNRKAKNIIVLIAKTLEERLFVIPLYSNMLRIISFYDETNITHDMLLACIEIRSDDSSNERRVSDVHGFAWALNNHLFDSVKITKEHGLLKISIHQLVMTALRLLCHTKDNLETQQSNYRNAATALTRAMESGGRFKSYHIQHELTMQRIIEKKQSQHKNVWDVPVKCQVKVLQPTTDIIKQEEQLDREGMADERTHGSDTKNAGEHMHQPIPTPKDGHSNRSPNLGIEQPSEGDTQSASNVKDTPDGNLGVYKSTPAEDNELSGDESDLPDIPIKVTFTTKVDILALYKPNKVYPMSSPIRGRVLIINNKVFSDPTEHPKRKGSDEDCRNLQGLFKAMSFDPVLHYNKSSTELKAVISEETKNPHHHIYGMFVLVLMSHGDKNAIYGTDGKAVKLETLMDLLTGKNFPDMQGKPKIVFVQACGGEKVDLVVFDSGVHTPAERFDVLPDEKEFRNTTDIFVVTPSAKGYKAARGDKKGAWFIRSLVHVFMNHACNLEFQKLIKMVDKRIAQKCKKFNEKYPENERLGQTVHQSGHLSKDLYLFPTLGGQLILGDTIPSTSGNDQDPRNCSTEDNSVGAEHVFMHT